MHKWKEKIRPIRLERRFEFETYQDTRDFLDKLGTLSESLEIYPDISFGKTYVNLSLFPSSEEENAAMSIQDIDFAEKVDVIFEA
ncbi:putative pterin-4 alpha-carbinolamine dehydratase-like protein [Prochlorococcus sp. MIT 0601]|nr:putative pterin-4 alpha-carbinolamine dehydratase-like protein [Prochlorococcus sp. MIT 0601]